MMVLDESTRHMVRNKLEEVLGAQAADAIMTSMPPMAWTDLATKSDLSELQRSLRTEIRSSAEQLRLEMRTGNEQLREQLRAEMRASNEQLREQLRSEMHTGNEQLRSEMASGFDQLRTEIHKGFAQHLRWTVGTIVAMVGAVGAVVLGAAGLV